jgi:hypothetical protein
MNVTAYSIHGAKGARADLLDESQLFVVDLAVVVLGADGLEHLRIPLLDLVSVG